MELGTLVLFLLGLVLLVAGAELLVRGASRLAAVVGISPLVVGLTVVALGTSSPELAVSVQAALAGQPEIALGNVIGSNIANVLLILGLSALVAPLVVSSRLIRFDVPVMIAASVLLVLMALDGTVSGRDGALLLAGIVMYTVHGLRSGRREGGSAGETEGSAEDRGRWPLHVGAVLAGLAMLVVGSRWLVAGAVEIATLFGVSEMVIGLTVVAVGTSLPEIATSLLAALRGERDIAVGNVVGSNIYNVLAILGVAAVTAPGGIAVPPASLAFDFPVMLAVALVCLPIFYTGGRISRWEGALLLGYYLAYTTLLVVGSASGVVQGSGAALGVGLAGTLLVLGWGVVREVRARRTQVAEA